MEKPKYDHWCKDVKFLGRFVGPKYGVEYDLYWCVEHGPEARHGDFPQDCASGIRFSSYHEGLMEALRRTGEVLKRRISEENRSDHPA